jgi:signal transduction histidine kinase
MMNATTKKLWRYQTQLCLAFAGFTLLLCTLFSLYALIFAFTVEDKFLMLQMQREAGQLEPIFEKQGRWPAPSTPQMRVIESAKDFPSDMRDQLTAHPQRREFFGAQGRHYHLLPLLSKETNETHAGPWLLWQAEHALVFRSMRETVFWILGLSASGALVLALGIAAWFGSRYARGFSDLAYRLSSWRPATGTAVQALAWPEAKAKNREQAQIENAMRQMLMQIGDLLKREQEFTASISHELRTPMSVIRSLSTQIRAAAGSRDESSLRLITDAAKRSESILKTLLLFARGSELEAKEEALLPTLEHIVLELSQLLPLARFNLDDGALSCASFRISKPALAILCHILLQNAALHGDGIVDVHWQDASLLIRNRISTHSHADVVAQNFGLLIAKRIATQFQLQLCSAFDAESGFWQAKVAQDLNSI